MSARSTASPLFRSISAICGCISLVLVGLFGAGCERSGTKEELETRYSNLVSPNNAITQAGDESRTGWFPDQPGLDPATVGGPNFKRLFKTALPLTQGEQVLAQPLVYQGKVLIVTEANNLYLLDANTGGITNQRALGGAFKPQNNGIGCGDITPTVGITGTPVIDNATGTAYFFSKSDTGVWTLHAIDATNLNERTGWPVAISGAAQNDATATFDAKFQHQRPGLLLMNGVIYGGFGAHCDIGGYRGWVIGVSTAGVIKARFTTVANAGSTVRGNGVWMSGAGLSSDGAGRIFFSTGNGYATNPYPNPLPGSTPPGDLEEAVARVNVQADGSLKSMDFFAPFNATALNGGDSDLGSGGVVLLPSQFGTASIPHLAVVAGKGGDFYLLNRDNLGGHKQGASGGDAALAVVPLGGATWSRAGVWPGDGGYIYQMTNGGTSTTGFRLQVLKYGTNAQGAPTMTIVGAAPDNFGSYSGSPIVTSNGTNSGSALVWATNLTSELRVYDAVPVNGNLNIRFRDAYGNQAKFTTIGVGSGKVYVGSGDGFVIGYGAGAAAVTGNPLAFGNVTVNQTKTLTATITAQQNVTITGLGVTNSVFTLGASAPALPATLSSGQSLTVPVSFKPTAAVGYTASLNITTSASGVGTVALSGTGQVVGPQLIATPASVNFGGVATGASSSKSVVLQNTGSQTLTFAGFTAPTAPFSASGVPASGVTLAAGATVTVTTTYSPTQSVTSTGNLVINSNGGNVNIPLTGTSGAPPLLVVTPLTNDFGTLAAGANKSMSFTVKNNGGLDLTITKSKPPALGKFVAQTTLAEGATLTPGQTLTETVSFSSAAAGTFTDTWEITGNDTSGLQTVHFSANVTAALTPLSRTGWVATASATGGADIASKALDGTAGSRWSSGLVQSGAATQTFTVDMLTAQSFSQITLDSGGDYARNYQVFASTDGTNWGTAIASGTGTAALTTITFAQQTARYLQVRQTTSAGTGSWWSIYELNVYGSGGGGGGGSGSPLPRAAWGVSASATGGADVPANAVDTTAGTRWSSGLPQSGAATQSFTIDMGSAQAFDKITLDSGGDYARSYQVYASNDTANWGAAIATGAGTAALTTITFAQKSARYIQIRQLTSAGQTAWWSIYDLNVYSPSGTGTALSRTGWIATGTASGDPPANAIDGNTGTRWSTGTAQVNGQFFQVDMLGTKTFKQITLDAAGSAADYPRGYQVFVSNDGAAWGAAIASGTPTTALVTINFATQTARYIKVVQTGTVTPNWWSLYEFNVYN
jgi:hypothetical protein